MVSVVSNLCPGDTARLVKETAIGNLRAARPLNRRLVALTRALFLSSNPIPLKAGMAAAGWCENRVRLPLWPADEALAARVIAAIGTYRGQPADTPVSGWMS